ncbi:MAG: hypothetical protein U9R72_07320 [Chloroflexota bacterium]|nr:hypothetical protein [Chloroflexota bacterium]
MMTEQPGASGSPFLQGLGRFLRFGVRLIVVAVIGASIGLGLYYGVPWLYRRLVLPVRENSARVAVLEERVEEQQQSISENHRALQDRVAELETTVAQLRDEVAIQGQDQQALEEEGEQLAGRMTQVEGELETREQDIARIEAEMEDTASNLREEIGAVGVQLQETQARLDRQIEETEGRMNDLGARVDGVSGRLALLQTAQDLVKVRLLLLEENAGAARDTLELALAHIDRAGALMPSQAEDLAGLRERILALDALVAERSLRVRPSLESLWADVMDLAVPIGAQSAVTATESTSPLPTPTPSP